MQNRRMNWPLYHRSQTKEKAEFMRLLYGLCRELDEQPNGNGRPKVPIRDRIFSMALKVYTTVATRRFIPDLNDAHKRRYIQTVPHYNSVIKAMNDDELTKEIHYLLIKSSLPLAGIETDFAVDSTGFGSNKYFHYYKFAHKHQKDYATDWVKCHVMCGNRTQIITAVEIAGRHAHDSFMFPHLLRQTAQHFNIFEVAGDKGYHSEKNMDLTAKHGGEPFIMFKSNSKVNKDKSETWRKMFYYFQYHRESFMRKYHKRSIVESAFSSIKAKFGPSVRSRNKIAQENEVLLKLLCHNLCVLIRVMHELDIELDWSTEEPVRLQPMPYDMIP